jgi:hypothetical protein
MTTAAFDTLTIRPDARFSRPEAQDICRQKMEAYVERGRAAAADVVSRVLSETPRDRYVPVSALRFEAEADTALAALVADERHAVHGFALDQVAERAGLRLGYLHDLMERKEQWAGELAASNLNTLLAHASGRFLVREVHNTIRGILSDSYRRIDSRPTFDALIGEADAASAVIVDGTYTETRVSLKVIRAEPIEVFDGEWMLFGFDYSNSDYGDGAHEISAFLLRLWCLNGAVEAKQVRRVHLGRRLTGDAFSERTLRLDAATQASATKDEVRRLLRPEASARLVEQIRRANETTIEPARVATWLKPRLTKTEVTEVSDKFASADVVELPPGQTTWRLSNAISWLAKNTTDGRRRMELERVAGEAI